MNRKATVFMAQVKMVKTATVEERQALQDVEENQPVIVQAAADEGLPVCSLDHAEVGEQRVAEMNSFEMGTRPTFARARVVPEGAPTPAAVWLREGGDAKAK